MLVLGVAGLRCVLGPLSEAIRKRKPAQRRLAGLTNWLGLSGLYDDYNGLLTELEREKGTENNRLLKIETALRNIREGALIVDEAHEILMANPAFSRLLNISREVVGERLEVFLNHGEFLDYLKSIEQGRDVEQKEIEISSGATSLYLEVSGSRFSPPGSADQRFVILVLHDISQQKKLEKIRKDFVANVSHELRTPLTIIKGYVDTLLDGNGQIAAEDQQRFLEKIGNNTNRLNLLLEDLMHLSRLEASKIALRYEPTDLNALVSEIVSEFSEKMNRHQHTVTLGLDASLPVVPIDAVKIAQVLENLLDNAFKYSPPGTSVRIETRQDGERVYVAVEDNGKGIPPEDLAHIFERFYRVDKGRSRVDGGTGLGLSIVKHVLLLHQGRVHAESKLGKGTRITFSLPLNAGVHSK